MSKQSKQNDVPSAGRGGKAAAPAVSTVSKSVPATGKPERGGATRKEERWTEMASFVVNFERRNNADGSGERRITAHKMQDGGITAQWTGVAQEPLVRWIADHVSDWGDRESIQAVAGHAAESSLIDLGDAVCDTTTVSLSITAIGAHTPGHSGGAVRAEASNGASSVALRSGAAFELSAVVEINAQDGRELPAASTPCTVQFFSVNTVTKQRSRLGEVWAGQAAGRSSLAATLPRVTLPAGSYRVTSVALLKGTPPKLAYAQGPLLEVV
jgi:hypothetical protein